MGEKMLVQQDEAGHRARGAGRGQALEAVVGRFFGLAQFGLAALGTVVIGLVRDGTQIPMAVVMAAATLAAAAALTILARPERRLVETGMRRDAP